MARPVKVRVSGLKELDEALGQFSKATARGVLRRVLMRAGKPIAEAAADHAPVRSGDLKESIRVSSRKPADADVGRAAFARVIRETGDRKAAGAASRAARKAAKASGQDAFAEVYVGPGRHPQAIQQEFGNVNHEAQPFMRPAWDAEKGTALKIITADLSDEIEKTAQRAAARAAKKAAGG